MPMGSANLGGATPALRAGVERYFEISLYLLQVTGFVTLASTGRLDVASLVFVSAALLYRGWLLLKRRSLAIPETWTGYATLAYIGFYALDYLFLSRSFVTATVHLVLFVMVVKIFSVQRNRDLLYLAVLSFLMVLAAAILTVDTVFLFSFCIFLVLAASTFTSMEIKRSFAETTQAAPDPAPVRQRRFPASLTTAALAMIVTSTLLGSVIFFVLPRLSAGYLSALAPDSEFITGFSSNVQLGKIGELKQSDTVVMHVEIDGDKTGAYDLKWRGIALALFNGRRWSAVSGQRQLNYTRDGIGFHIDQVTDASPWERIDRRARGFRQVQYRVLMEPLGTNVFFVAPFPLSLRGNYSIAAVDSAGSVFSHDRRPIDIYEATSNIAEPPARLLRAAPAVTGMENSPYLQLPQLDARVPALAKQVTANATNNYDRAIALETYLKTRYGYTLELSKMPPTDPLAEFLFERKEGHCEYFATAMAVMLRTLGIPARLVNGFHNGEFNDLTSTYIVRARDAHTWVEAWFPGYGWITFDPTPPDPKVARSAWWSRTLLYLDAAREFWREWVINYDLSHQLRIDREFTRQGTNYIERLRSWGRAFYAKLVERARRAQDGLREMPRRNMVWIVMGFAGLLFALNARRLWRTWRRQRLAARPERAPRAAATVWYERMTHDLARRGLPKSPTQTPSEFAATLQDASLRGSVAKFTEAYENARFGDARDDAGRLPELFEEVHTTR